MSESFGGKTTEVDYLKSGILNVTCIDEQLEFFVYF